MANNNNNNNNNRSNNNEHVEFSVRAEEDLFLEGTEQTIRRVTALTNYSCLMLKTQRFSSLFRHYAKYHGLRKDDLEYYFVNILENEDTPEMVQLQRGDTIMVRKRRQTEYPILHTGNKTEFFKDMKELLLTEDDPLKDVSFSVGGRLLRAHKSVLVGRSQFFRALFRKNAFQTPQCVKVDDIYQPRHVECVLEFLYTNRAKGMTGPPAVSAEDLMLLAQLADQWMIDNLMKLVELELGKNHISMETVAVLFVHAKTKPLKEGCLNFIRKHFKELAGSRDFQDLLMEYPEFCMPILQSAADRIVPPPPKKPRPFTRSALE